MKIGAHLVNGGVEYCVWAPESRTVTVEITRSKVAKKQTLEMAEGENGYRTVFDTEGEADDAYGFRVNGGKLLPDPASRCQKRGVHGVSVVTDPKKYRWKDEGWRKPSFRDVVLYELHVGTFSPAGTFRGVTRKMRHLAELGVTAIELMPIAEFPGTRNWGYDGVLIYAPSRSYGAPDDLRELVDTAHAHGIAVVLDVVYNHFGPDGNYLAQYSGKYFSSRHKTPWGDGFNFDSPESAEVRRFFVENPAYWMEDFHIDGFRFDASDQVKDDSHPHLLAEMTERIHERGGYAIAEFPFTDIAVRERKTTGYDAVWADDFHHVIHAHQTGERHSYYRPYAGSAHELARTLLRGWLPQDGGERAGKAPRPEFFIHCLSNHDQVGNRAQGERLNQMIPAEAYRALSVVLCLSPFTPLLFMGQEWAATTPFLFFTDHVSPLGRDIAAGRKAEFSLFPDYKDPEKISPPQSPETFARSKLKWEETQEEPHAAMLALYRECLRLRKEIRAFRPERSAAWEAAARGCEETFVLTLGPYVLAVNLEGSPGLPLRGEHELLLSSQEERFGGNGRMSWNAERGAVFFHGPETVLLRRERIFHGRQKRAAAHAEAEACTNT